MVAFFAGFFVARHDGSVSASRSSGSRILVSLLLCAVSLGFARAESASTAAVWETDTARFELRSDGAWSRWARRSDGANYLSTNQPAPLLSVRRGGTWFAPMTANWDAAASRLRLGYPSAGITAVVRVTPHPSHLTFELMALEPAPNAEAVQWGPFPTRIRQTVGEVVGVVRDAEFALGLQALNPKTLGGSPENEEGNTDRPYAASTTSWGSLLHAYSLDRSKPRRLDVWSKRAPNMPVAAIPGETVLGSKIALFGCPEPQALEILGRIETTEGLPHPLIDGVWAKVSSQRGRSYLIADYSEADVDELLGYVKRANLMSLYHGNAFRSWGHFEPNPKYFSNGVAGVKACADKAKALGIRLGAHTLSDFIQTQDPYVTPVPDPQLVQTGSSPLTEDVDAAATTLPVASPEYFAQERLNEMHTVRIGQELVRYGGVSTAPPWRLLDCQRGAFGTQPGAHSKGTEVGKLMDHGYKVFFPDFDLLREMARTLAKRFNETGWSHMDFDGHEGCLAMGQGTYGNEVFAKEFYDHLDHMVVNGTSPPLSHFYWHINSYCNWGEPWYGGFRDSMQEYRLNNQAFCERNYLPKMLGWYLLTLNTCLSDMEWTLARAAGYDAGFALATSLNALRKNPATGPILDAIREWEEARRSGAFPDALRADLRNPKREFHLQRAADGWELYPFHDSPEFAHEAVTRQPGEPTASEWDLPNPDAAQEVQFKLRVLGTAGSVSRLQFEVGRAVTLEVPAELTPGQSLLVEGDGVARIYDTKGSHLKTLPLKANVPRLAAGPNRVRFDCEFQGETPPKVVVTFKTRGEPIRVRK